MKKLLLALFALPLFTFGQVTTTIDFDTNSKWTTSGTGYGNHSYNDGLFRMTSVNIFKENNAPTGGYPAYFGTSAIRLRHNQESSVNITITSNGVSTFSFKVRGWALPNPKVKVSYSIDGTTFVPLTPINNAFLGGSNEWKVYTGEINSDNNNIIIKLEKDGVTSNERAMIDDFTWTEYVEPAPACSFALAGLTAITCDDNGTPTVENDDKIKFSLNPTATNNATAYNVTVPVGYTVTPTTANFGAATEFTLTHANGAAGNGDVIVTLTDATTATCTLDVTVTDPGICSVATVCTINNAQLSGITCDNNGTPIVENDDNIKFTLNPLASVHATTYNVTVPTGYTVTPTSANYGAATEFTLTHANGAAGSGDVLVTLTDATDTDCTLDVTVADPGICSNATPTLASSVATITAWSYLLGTTPTVANFTFNGNALNSDVTVTAPAEFEISKDNVTFEGTLTYVLGSQTAMVDSIVYVRPAATSTGTFTGNITLATTGATTVEVAVSATVTGYTVMTIPVATEKNQDNLSSKKGQLAIVEGVIHCMDFKAGAGYNMTILDPLGNGIYVFKNRDIVGYANPVAGEKIKVYGKIDQFNGLIQIAADTIIVLSTGEATLSPTLLTTDMNYDNTVNKLIRIEGLTLPSGITNWPTNGNINATAGTKTYSIRITPASDLSGAAIPEGPFNVEGIGTIYKTSAPFNSGFQILPCGSDGISLVPACDPLSDSIIFNQSNLTLTPFEAADPDITYIWGQCVPDLGIVDFMGAGSTNRVFNVSEEGVYTVKLIREGCAPVVAECLEVVFLSTSNVLANATKVYPNPFNTSLTIVSEKAVAYNVIDIQGKTIVSTSALNNTTTINTADWTQGVYFIEFAGANGEKHTVKMVK